MCALLLLATLAQLVVLLISSGLASSPVGLVLTIALGVSAGLAFVGGPIAGYELRHVRAAFRGQALRLEAGVSPTPGGALGSLLLRF